MSTSFLLVRRRERLVAARAILGEWLAGSGGGWQDSGGLWPGIKLITGVFAAEGDPEFGVSRGRLLPSHRIFGRREVSDPARRALMDSLVVVHGGMAQNVGPILEMVTEKYLLRSGREWTGRLEALALLCEQPRVRLEHGITKALESRQPLEAVLDLRGVHLVEEQPRRRRSGLPFRDVDRDR